MDSVNQHRVKMNTSRKTITIELLRFLFAGIVVLHHSRYLLGDDNCYFLGGSLAVEFFLFVSGYLLMTSAGKRAGAVKTADSIESSVNAAVEGLMAGADANGKMSDLGSRTFGFLMHKIKGFLPEFVIAWGIGFTFAAAVQHWNLHQIWRAFRDDFWELTLVKMSGLYTNGIDGVMWYLSAMLLAMAVLYPLLMRFRDMMSHIVCPLTALFIYGYLCREQGHPRDPSFWTGLFYKGFLRTMAGLCVGIVIYMAVKRCRRMAPNGLTAMGNCLAALTQAAILIISIRYMWLEKPSDEDYFYMFLLMLLVLMSFAGWGWEPLLHRDAKPAWCVSWLSMFLGRYSLPLYLGHIYFAQHMNEIPALASMTGHARMGIYVGLSLVNGFLIMGFAELWRRKRENVCAALKRVLVRKSSAEDMGI